MFPRWARWLKSSDLPSKTSKVFTDEKGFYSASGLIPGTYSVKAIGALFSSRMTRACWSARGRAVIVNVTLNTLFDAMQLAPRELPMMTMTGNGCCVRSLIVRYCGFSTIRKVSRKLKGMGITT